MKRGLVIGAMSAFLLTGPALGDEAAECTSGIEMIKAELAKNPADDVKTKLEKFLADAEREAGEREYDECLDAVTDAKEVVGG